MAGTGAGTGNGLDSLKLFIGEHLIKVLWGISIFYLVGMANDFKDVKTILQTMAIQQAQVELRIQAIEKSDAEQNIRLGELEHGRLEFYKNYDIQKRDK